MKYLGITVFLEDGVADYVKKMREIGFKAFHIHAGLEPDEKLLESALKELYDLGVYLSVAELKRTPVEMDDLYPYLIEKGKLLEKYTEVLEMVNDFHCVQVIGLPRNLHFSLYKSEKPNGIYKEKLIDIIKEISHEIHESGFSTAMHVQPGNLDCWGVPFDIYDVDGLVEHSLQRYFTRLGSHTRKIWLSDVRQSGAYNLTRKPEFVKELKEHNEIHSAFLYSHKHQKRHRWSFGDDVCSIKDLV